MSAQEVIMDLPKVLKCDPLESKLSLGCVKNGGVPSLPGCVKEVLKFAKEELKHQATLMARMFEILGGLFCFVRPYSWFITFHSSLVF